MMRAPRPPRVAPPQRYCITVPLAFVVSDSCAGSARKEQPPGSKSRWCVASICHWFEQPARGCSADSCGSRALCSKCENVDPDLWRENLDWLGRLLNLTEGSSFSECASSDSTQASHIAPHQPSVILHQLTVSP